MLQVRADTDEIAVASWRSLLVIAFRKNRTIRSMTELERAEAGLIAEVGKIEVLSLVPPLPFAVSDGPTRAKTDQVTKRFAPSLRATAMVIQGEGIGVAMTRSLATAAMALMTSSPTKVFPHVPPALRWLAARDVSSALAGSHGESMGVLAEEIARLVADVGLAGDGEPGRRTGS